MTRSKVSRQFFCPGVIGDIPTETEVALRQFVERGGVIYRSGVSGEVAMEWDIPDVSEVDEALRERYRQILEKAKVATIRTEPDLPTIHAFASRFKTAQPSFSSTLPMNPSLSLLSFPMHLTPIGHHKLRITNYASRPTPSASQ